MTSTSDRRRGGPVPYLLRQAPPDVKLAEGLDVVRLVSAGSSIRGAAQACGMSSTTAWRRYWWVLDWTLPRHHGLPAGPFPHQRGTRACPSGRPYLPTLDGARHQPRPTIRRVNGLPVCDRGLAWTIGSVARRIGVSPERARQLSHTVDFPQPVGVLSGARAWAAEAVEKWIREHRPALADRPDDGPDIAVEDGITAAG